MNIRPFFYYVCSTSPERRKICPCNFRCSVWKHTLIISDVISMAIFRYTSSKNFKNPIHTNLVQLFVAC